MSHSAEAQVPAPVRRRRPLRTSAWLLVLVIVLLGFGFVASRSEALPAQGPKQPEVVAAQNAIETMANPGSASQAQHQLPADFTQFTGTVVSKERAWDGTVRTVNPRGGCSAPWGDDNTKWDFSVPCKAHDLGYDVLRYSEKKGQPLDQGLRRALDDRLTTDMHTTCAVNPKGSPKTCDAVASLYSAGLETNSWHQRWGPPVSQSMGSMVAGVAVVGFLLVFRLRGWLRLRRYAPKQAAVPSPIRSVKTQPARWAVLGVGSLVLVILGETVVALARWADVGEEWVWPVTWLTQLTPIFFFAGGHANGAGWRSVLESGHGYREYLAHRASWLLRPTLIFVVVAVVMPIAVELLGVPYGTGEAVIRIALHPLWLLGMYLFTVVITPAMLLLNKIARRYRLRLVPAVGLAGIAVLTGVSSGWLSEPVSHYLPAFLLAILAQQLAFLHADTGKPRRRWLVTGAALGLTTLVILVGSGATPLALHTVTDPAPVLATPTVPFLILGLVQLCLLGLLAKPLIRLARTDGMRRIVRFSLRAPMSLYLGFLATMLLFVGVVYLPGRFSDVIDWLVKPHSLVALAMLAGPAGLVFLWFERHHVGQPTPRADGGRTTSRFDRWLGHLSLVLGTSSASIGVFGFALTGLAGTSGEPTLLGLTINPMQNLIHLLLGVFLLHVVRTGASAKASTWALAALACVPSILAATEGTLAGSVDLAVHSITSACAVTATAITIWERYATNSAAHHQPAV